MRYLVGEPHPTLSGVHQRKLARRIIHRMGRHEALFRSCSKFFARHFTHPLL